MADDYISNLQRTTASNYSIQPGESIDYPKAKLRQAIKIDVSDSAHTVTNRPPITTNSRTDDN